MSRSLRVTLGALFVLSCGASTLSCTLDDEGEAVSFPSGYQHDGGDETGSGGVGGTGIGGTGADGGSGGTGGVGGGGGGGGAGGASGVGGDGGAGGVGGTAGDGGAGGGSGTGGIGGAAGQGGTAGTGGDGGAAGQGGTAGTGGDGGAAGQGGTAGTGGDGGAAGQGGTAGTGGVGGSAGDGGAAGAAGSGGSGGTGGAAGAGGTGGAAGSGGTGGIGGSGGTGGAAGSGGSPVAESCLDGLDNDLDSKIDCADGDCAAFACVDGIPPGWEGYFYLRTTTFSGTPPQPVACQDGSAPSRFYENPRSAENCQCSCGPVSGAACSPAPIECATGNGSCNSASNWTSDLADGNCHKPGSGAQLSCRLTGPAPVSNAGKCTPTKVLPHPEPFEFIQDACRTPDAVGGGCGGSKVCTQGPTAEYPAPVCIRQFGLNACPQGWNNPVVAFQAYNDLRTCADCVCTPQSGTTTCAGTEYTAYDTNTCGGGTSVVNTDACKNLSGLADGFTWSMRLTKLPTPSGGTCATSGGQGAGIVETLSPATFCCK